MSKPDEGDPAGTQVPGSARQNPQQAVDALEERVFGSSPAGEQADQGREPDPAIEQNLDAQDLGTAEAGDEPSG